MDIAIIGGGAIGSLVAACLVEQGREVVLISRKEHADVINEKGLSVKGFGGEKNIKIKALTKLDKEYDLVIFATKTQDLEDAYQENNEYLENCYVLTTQNGVQADSILGVHFEKEKMLSSVVMFGATYVKPGYITFNFSGDWIIGRPYVPLDKKTHEIAELLNSDIPVVFSNNIVGMKWVKLFVNFNNCICALVGKSMQETFADMNLCKLSILLLREGIAIVNKANIELVSLPTFPVDRIMGLVSIPFEQASGIINQTLTKLSDEPLYGSILQSIMRNKDSEIDFINGEVVQLAKQMRDKAPLNEKVVDLVHEVEKTKKFMVSDELIKVFELDKV
ncbi:MAG: 2-dehydropantoate 2-reductase [Candidatus Omnitrophica bacterium]|nr:2-dehydropantoate 2-reductase [Candidatus Omnitrophota bacterium]MBU1997802.1 2-dehydropantoate 2-reductase [Candidatus Omnitrophota bacterium]